MEKALHSRDLPVTIPILLISDRLFVIFSDNESRCGARTSDLNSEGWRWRANLSGQLAGDCDHAILASVIESLNTILAVPYSARGKLVREEELSFRQDNQGVVSQVKVSKSGA